MITDLLIEEAKNDPRKSILKKEVRSYEVSLWTLQDEFITVLKWSDVEQKGRILNPKLVLNVDGTLKFSFSIPMYLDVFHEGDHFTRDSRKLAVIRKEENPIWYNTRNGNLITGLRKIKIILNKADIVSTADATRHIFEVVINKITETHEGEQLFCNVECESLAFHELGKVGYKYTLSLDNYILDKKNWDETGQWTKKDGTIVSTAPKQNIQYWCEQCRLEYLPGNRNLIDPHKWYYRIEMNWKSFTNTSTEYLSRSENVLYEEEYVSSWGENLEPLKIEASREKYRPVEIKESNLYNISLSIAEAFEVYCKYEYEYDANYQIISRCIVFYNNYIKDRENVLCLTYPYSSSNISREMDSTELTTKMYVRPLNDSSTLESTVSIINSPANDMGEDYLFNFDYLHDIGAITEELYAEIEEYKKDMHRYNEQLLNKSLELAAAETEQTEVKANISVLKNSASYAAELVDYSSSLFNRLTTTDSVTGESYIERSMTNPYVTTIREDNVTHEKYITFNELDKGIIENSILIYMRRDTTAESNQLSELIDVANYIIDKDEYNDVTKVRLNITLDSDASRLVYVIYNYQPHLYYDSVLKTWLTRLANDQSELEDENARLETIEATIATLEAEYNAILAEKDQRIVQFNSMMGAALREGYWEPKDYIDYGDAHENTLTFTSTFVEDSLIPDSEKDMIIGWDNELFISEDKNYFEKSVLQDKLYYPCIDISDSAVLSALKTALGQNKTISFIFLNNYYKTLTQEEYNKILNITNYTLRAGAKFGFIRTGANNIKPVLMITGCKNLTDSQIKFMLTHAAGNPRIAIINSEINSSTGEVDTTINTLYTIPEEKIYWMTSLITDADAAGLRAIQDISECETVYPRLKFSSLKLKTDTESLKIKYDNKLLTKYDDYSVLNRSTTRDDKAYLETFVTIKPEVMIKAGTYTGAVNAKYILSNAATSVYLDAKDVLFESAYPKVSYSIATHILMNDFIESEYNMLSLLVMINDTDLKFQNVFGYISLVTLDLDQVQNDELEIKNYKTKFEDLFSAIVASTEEMKRSSAGMAVAIGGGVPLNTEAFESTLLRNGSILNAYLDSYFDDSQVVIDKLSLIFTEAGKILSDANSAVGKTRVLTLENAKILGGFVENISANLIPKVYTGPTLPTDFKEGDVWNETDENGVIIGRYVATSSSESSANGFTRTFDGTLAAIKGANMEYDAVAGTVDIYGEHEITLRSGEHVYVAAGDSVDIVGNRAVNIGGATINIAASDSSDIEGGYVTGGINLVSSNINFNQSNSNIESAIANAISSNSGSLSKVLIHPDLIELGGADIIMKGSNKIQLITSRGTEVNTSAIEISPDTGVWIGSGQGVRLFSGGFSYNASTNTLTKREAAGASIELNSEHLILGFANTKTGNANAIEMTEDHVIIAQGGYLNYNPWEEDHSYSLGNIVLYNNEYYRCKEAHTSSSAWDSSKWNVFGVTGNTDGLVGVRITKNSIGMATGSGETVSAILINNTGVSIGSGSVDLTLTTADLRAGNKGSYVRIAGNGIELGSLANLYINANNFKFLTDSRRSDLPQDLGSTIVAIGKNLQGISADTTMTALRTKIATDDNTQKVDVNLVLNQYGLFAKGVVYADAFLADCTAGLFYADANSLGFYQRVTENNETRIDPIMTLSGTRMVCHEEFLIVSAEHLYLGVNTTLETRLNNMYSESIKDSVKVYTLHDSITTPPTTVVDTATADANWTTYIPPKSNDVTKIYLWSCTRTHSYDGHYHYYDPSPEGEIDKFVSKTYYEYTRTSALTPKPDVTNNNIWSLTIPAPTTGTATYTDPSTQETYTRTTISNPYVWRARTTIDRKGTLTRELVTDAPDDSLSNISAAATTANNIALGLYPVPVVSSTGISIDGDSLTVGSTGTVKIAGNNGVYIYSNDATVANLTSGTATKSAIILNSDGITLATNKSLAMAAGSELYLGTSSLSNTILLNDNGITLSSAGSLLLDGTGSITIKNGNTNAITMNNDGITIHTGKALNVTAGLIKFTASETLESAMTAADADAQEYASIAETNAKTHTNNYMNGTTQFTKIDTTGFEIGNNSFKMKSTGTMEIAAESSILIRANALGTNNAVILNKDGIEITTHGLLKVDAGKIQMSSSGTDTLAQRMSDAAQAAEDYTDSYVGNNSSTSREFTKISNTGFEITKTDFKMTSTGTMTIGANASIDIKANSSSSAVLLNKDGIEITSGKKLKVSAADLEFATNYTASNLKSTAEQGVADAATAQGTADNIVSGTTAVPHVSTTGITINSSGVTITSAANFSLTTNGTIDIQSGGIFKVNTINFIVNSAATGNSSIFEVKYQNRDENGNLIANSYSTAIKSTNIETVIGGWHVHPEWLWGGDGSSCVCLVGPNASSHNTESYSHVNINAWAIYAGADWPEEPPSGTNATPHGWAPFRVTRSGTVYGKDICVGNGPSWLPEYNENDSRTYSTDNWSGYTGYLWFWAADTDHSPTRYGWKKFDGNAFVLTIYLTTKPKDYGNGTLLTIGAAIGSIFSWISGQSSCFLAGTKVNLPDDNTIEIEKLTVGKEILVYDEARKRFTTAPVRAIKAYPHHSNIYELHLSNGNILFLTDDHPVLTRKGWKVANPAKFKKDDAHQLDVSMFEVNDILPTNGEDVILEEIIHRTDLQDMTVYNFDVEAYDGYVVEGIIARNYEVK